jgi:hypothetical protein
LGGLAHRGRQGGYFPASGHPAIVNSDPRRPVSGRVQRNLVLVHLHDALLAAPGQVLDTRKANRCSKMAAL